MITLDDIQLVSKTINEVSISLNLATETSNLSKYSRLFATNPTAQAQVFNTIDKLVNSLTSIETVLWSDEQIQVLEKLNIDKLVGDKARQYFNDIKRQLQSSPTIAPSILTNVVNDLNNFRTKPAQLLSILQPFELTSTVPSLEDTEGVIEIIFDGKVKIENFANAKEQMNEWYLIVDGYARALNISKEDLEIIGISKNSPTKFKIKTTLTIAGLVLGIVLALLEIEKTILERKIMIEKLKQNPIVKDSTMHNDYVEQAEKEIQRIVDKGIEDVTDLTLQKHNINLDENNGDIKVSLAKGIENQYNFVVNGGTVNIHITNGELKKNIDSLEKTKNELRMIRENYENIKTLTQSSNDSTGSKIQ